MGGVERGRGKMEMDGFFWVKTIYEVAGGWAVWSPVLGGWVLMVADGRL
jgi:hypothetical protein